MASSSSSPPTTVSAAFDRVAIAAGNLVWCQETLTSKDKARDYLSPQLDNNTLTQNDFDKAVEFLPTMKPARQHNILDASATGVLFGSLFIRRNKPWFGLGRFALVSTVTSLAMLVYREKRRYREYGHFLRSLEDPQGFSRAIHNIRSLGKAGSFPIEAQWPDRPDVVKETDWDSPAWATSDPRPDPVPQGTTSLIPGDRWEQIRAANARRTEQGSSWDALRQRHERAQLQASPGASDDGASDRAREQAKFDAMLEEERRKSSSST